LASEKLENIDMRKSMVAIGLLAIVACARATPVRAGSGSSAWDKLSILLTGKRAEDKFRIIHVTDLAALRADPNSHVVILDANVDATRESYGVIPGARLLSSYDNYDVATELPPAKTATLVFYCANWR
jgi:hypothetical protein